MRFAHTASIGILLLLLPSVALADALSPWVQQVIERSQAGVAMATSMYSGSCEDTVIRPEIEQNLSKARDMISTTRDLAVESQFLREHTLCYENDRRLLLNQLEAVRNELTFAIETCNVTATKALRDNLEFLARAYDSFLVGGEDPTFRDSRLQYQFPFHNQTLWDSGSAPVFDTGATVPLCPFTTEYSPHSYGYVPVPGGVVVVSGPSADMRSFGCDRTVQWTIPVTDLWHESDVQIAFMDRYQGFYESLYNLLIYTLPLLPGAQPGITLPGAAPPPPHEKLDGCLRSRLPGSALGIGDPGPEDAGYFDGILAADPGYFDEINMDPVTGSFEPPAGQILPVGMLLRSPYDLFLTLPNPTILMRKYLDLRALMGRARPLANAAKESSGNIYLSLAYQRTYPTQLQRVSSNIEQELGVLDAWHRDAIGKSKEGLRPLTEAVNSLLFVVNKELPEKYIPDLTYFLMRSCVDGPCQETLKNVMRRTFNPYCHPYVKRLYIEDDAHKKCLCDPSVDSGFLGQYCNEDYDASRYPEEGTLIPGCQVENTGMASSGG